MMMIRQEDDPAFFRFITDGNLLRQYDFLVNAIKVALKDPDFRIGHDIVRELNHYAVTMLCETPGRYRQTGVVIRNAPHRPPPHGEVEGHMNEFVRYLAENWYRTPCHLAAYALWRLCWIHPFIEGNGRTARAVCYLVLCVKHGFALPGENTVPKQIRDDRAPYYDALRVADNRYAAGHIDTRALETYLEGLLLKQLQS